VQVETARDSLAGAAALGGKLPAPLGAEVVDVGRAVSTHAVQLGALSAALIAALLRRARGLLRCAGSGSGATTPAN
jgi:hypothetical protein